MTISASLLAAIVERRKFDWIIPESEQQKLLAMAKITGAYWRMRRTQCF